MLHVGSDCDVVIIVMLVLTVGKMCEIGPNNRGVVETFEISPNNRGVVRDMVRFGIRTMNMIREMVIFGMKLNVAIRVLVSEIRVKSGIGVKCVVCLCTQVLSGSDIRVKMVFRKVGRPRKSDFGHIICDGCSIMIWEEWFLPMCTCWAKLHETLAIIHIWFWSIMLVWEIDLENLGVL